MNKFIFVLVFLSFYASANAEWVMFHDNKQTFLYSSVTGAVFIRVVDESNNPIMMHIPFANGASRFFDADAISKNMKSPSTKPKRED